MAVYVGASVMDKVLGITDAEKAFRPWWDILEDYCVYTLVVLGLVVFPTAMVTNKPMDCTFCIEDKQCPPYPNIPHNLRFSNTINFKNNTNPNYRFSFVNKWCNLNNDQISDFIIYLPYILLLSALLLFVIEKFFLKVYKAGLKIEKLHKEIILQNEPKDNSEIIQLKARLSNLEAKQNELHKDNSDLSKVEANTNYANVRRNFLKSDKKCFRSYLVRTFLQIIISTALLVSLCTLGLHRLNKIEKTIYCNVHNFLYECSGAPQDLYLKIVYITIGINGLCLFSNIINLIWLLFPSVRRLHRVMTSYKSSKGENNLDDIYYKNADLQLLLGLLSASSGIAQAIAFIANVDKEFRDALKLTEDFELSPLLKCLLKQRPHIHLMFEVVEIEKNITSKGAPAGNKTSVSKQYEIPDDWELMKKEMTTNNAGISKKVKIVVNGLRIAEDPDSTASTTSNPDLSNDGGRGL